MRACSPAEWEMATSASPSASTSAHLRGRAASVQAATNRVSSAGVSGRGVATTWMTAASGIPSHSEAERRGPREDEGDRSVRSSAVAPLPRQTRRLGRARDGEAAPAVAVGVPLAERLARECARSVESRAREPGAAASHSAAGRVLRGAGARRGVGAERRRRVRVRHAATRVALRSVSARLPASGVFRRAGEHAREPGAAARSRLLARPPRARARERRTLGRRGAQGEPGRRVLRAAQRATVRRSAARLDAARGIAWPLDADGASAARCLRVAPRERGDAR